MTRRTVLIVVAFALGCADSAEAQRVADCGTVTAGCAEQCSAIVVQWIDSGGACVSATQKVECAPTALEPAESHCLVEVSTGRLFRISGNRRPQSITYRSCNSSETEIWITSTKPCGDAG